MSASSWRRQTPRWVVRLEIAVLLVILTGLGVARFSRLTPGERLEIQLEAGLLQLHELEYDHLQRQGTYFDPGDPTWRPYLPWMDRHAFEARHDGDQGWSVVVHADLDDDGEPGAWHIDHTEAVVRRVVPD